MEGLAVFLCVFLASITSSCYGCAQPRSWDISGHPRLVAVSRVGLPSLVPKTADFHLIDTNNDNLVSATEWQQAFAYLLENYDTNGDGMISLSELSPSSLAAVSNTEVGPGPRSDPGPRPDISYDPYSKH